MLDFKSKNNKDCLVVFVHGFLGGKETWHNSNKQSFSELLLTSQDIAANFDFAEFNYFTKLIHSKKLSAISKFLQNLIYKVNSPATFNISIDELASILSSELRIKAKQYKKIVLVAHSMGGLVSKSCILSAIRDGVGPIIDGFISLAVPHSGVELATLGHLVSKNVQISDLKPLGKTLKYLNHHWTQQKNLPFALYLYGAYDQVVPETSAVPTGETSKPICCECDHFTISKPETIDDTVYLAVLHALQDIANDFHLHNVLTIKELEDPDDKFNEELFVVKLIVADIHANVVNHAKELFFNAEYAKKLYSSNSEFDKLKELYIKIKNVYQVEFTKLLGGTIKNSHDLVASVYEKIQIHHADILSCTLPYLECMHKQGMLHQLANDLEKDIWWASEHSIKTIEEFKKRKGIE